MRSGHWLDAYPSLVGSISQPAQGVQDSRRGAYKPDGARQAPSKGTYLR